MSVAVPARRPLDKAAALVGVFAMAVGLIVATWLVPYNGSPFSLGALVLLGWGLYPGAASVLALRSDSEAPVAALATLLPALAVAWFVVPDSSTTVALFLPLAAAVGVFVGMWAGTATIRRAGRARILTGVIAAGLAGAMAAMVIALPALLIVT